MAEGVQTPPRASKGIGGWIKKNKLLAFGGAGLAGVLYFSQKGSSSDIGEDGATLLAPSAAVGIPDEAYSGLPAEAFNQFGEFTEARAQESHESAMSAQEAKQDSAASAQEHQQEMEANPAPPPDTTPAAAAPAAGSTGFQGVEIMGHKWPGAISHNATRSGKDGKGEYVVHKIRFPARVEYWRRYHRDPKGKTINKWVKESSRNVTSSTPPPPPQQAATQPAPNQAATPQMSATGIRPAPPKSNVPAGYHAGGNVGGVRDWSGVGVVAWRKTADNKKDGANVYDAYNVRMWDGSTKGIRHYVGGPKKGQWQA